jgi:hypothetical protein
MKAKLKFKEINRKRFKPDMAAYFDNLKMRRGWK